VAERLRYCYRRVFEFGGSVEIRTLEPFRVAGFQDRCLFLLYKALIDVYSAPHFGSVAERLKAPVLKTGDPKFAESLRGAGDCAVKRKNPAILLSQGFRIWRKRRAALFSASDCTLSLWSTTPSITGVRQAPQIPISQDSGRDLYGQTCLYRRALAGACG
jgi:hypothetical protein